MCFAANTKGTWKEKRTICFAFVVRGSCSVVSDSVTLWPARLLCPWNFQARILGWVAIPFFRGSSWPRARTCFSRTGWWVLYHLKHQGWSFHIIFVHWTPFHVYYTMLIAVSHFIHTKLVGMKSRMFCCSYYCFRFLSCKYLTFMIMNYFRRGMP